MSEAPNGVAEIGPGDDFDFPSEGESQSEANLGENLPQVEEASAEGDSQEGETPSEKVEDTPAGSIGGNIEGDGRDARGEDGRAELTPEQTIADLQKRVSDLMGVVASYETQKLQQPPSQELKDKARETPPPAEVPRVEVPLPGQITTLDFLQGEEDHTEILASREKFNTLLNKVATVSFTAAINAAQEQIMMRIPQLVQTSAQQQMAIQNVTTEFYAQNKDLAPYRQAVSMAAMQLYNENPKLELADLLKGAAQRTREILHLTQSQRKRRPAQPAGGSIRSGGSSRTPQSQNGLDELSEQQRQILELLS